MKEMNEIEMKAGPERRWVPGFLFLIMSLSSVVWIEPSPYDLLLLLFALLGCFCSFYGFHSRLLPPLLLLLLFLFANLLSAFFAKSASEAVSFLAITVFLAVSWLAVIGVSYRHPGVVMEKIFQGYAVAAFLAVLLGVGAYFLQLPFSASLLEFGRVKSLFKDPNVFGPFIVPAALYALYRAESSRSVRKLGYFGLFFLFLLGILLSFSRAAWGNCGLALGCYFLIISDIPLRKRLATLAVFLLAGTALFLALVHTPMIDGLLDQRIGLQHYDTDRFATQKAAFETGLSNPLGLGPGQIEQNFDLSTHSLYARIFTENGLLGFLSFGGFLLLGMAQSLKLALGGAAGKAGRGIGLYAVVFASLVGLAFNSFFIDTLHWRHLWLLLALAWCLNQPIEMGRDEDEHGRGH